ncbi:MAG: hypothetical protein Unbinned3891contig1000_3 [Prokaryotic dsDNA virus sp.]|nr:MAG: hypothetical protein Unbinned3891contig1000_3 [Prokaryotic dsDNA virus sp.]|tara:strand:- start:27611 stop:28036 length:426 start_codon:yes stop_codon:yes gene_type:complete
MNEHWTTPYLRIPYVEGGRVRDGGVDCWGLLRVVYEERYGIHLPEHPGISADSVQEKHKLIVDSMHGEWLETEDPENGHAVAMSQSNAFHHVGLVAFLNHKLHILHAWNEPTGIIIENLRQIRQRGLVRLHYFVHKQWPTS